MLNLAFISLAIFLLVMLVLMVLAFLDVAFAGPDSRRKWRPPLARGDQLLTWASKVAQATVSTRLFAPRTKETAKQLVEEICEGATYAISQAPQADAPPKLNFPNCRYRMIGVTAPEVLALAGEIRRKMPTRDAERIRQRAAENAATVAGLNHEQYEQTHILCPFWSEKNSCDASNALPFQCRGWCSFTGPERDRCLPADGDASPSESYARTVGQGAADGLCRGLESAGLDGHVYELNGALATALETPDAAEQWAEGKPVFADCKLYE